MEFQNHKGIEQSAAGGCDASLQPTLVMCRLDTGVQSVREIGYGNETF